MWRVLLQRTSTYFRYKFIFIFIFSPKIVLFVSLIFLNLFLGFTGQGLEHVLVGALANRLLGAPSPLTFSVGDKVKVNKDVETLKSMQEGHGGWNPRMAQVCFALISNMKVSS